MTNFSALLQPQVKELGQDREVPCRDPSCAGLGQPEQDGDHRYMECDQCGMDFNYVKMETNVLVEDQDGNCSVGIPADIRRASSSGMEKALADQAVVDAPRPRTSLGLTIGKRVSD